MISAIILLFAGACLVLAFGPTRGKKLSRLRALVRGEEKSAPVAAIAVEQLLPPFIALHLRQLGLTPTARDIFVAGAALLISAIAAAIFVNVFFGVALAGAMALCFYAGLNILAARRIARLGALMPGFFDRVRQLLAVGNSPPTAFSRAVQSAQPLVAAFFAPALRRMGNGAGLAESVQQCAEDSDLHEMRLFAAAIATNMRFGGALTHSLGNLVAYLRKRAAIERELRADTAQIRASAWILGLLPLLVAAMIVAQNRDYARWFIDHPAGHKMLAYCAFSQIAGTLLMRKIVRMAF